MIQSNDLRLGNKVLWNDLICTVAGIQYFIDADENKEGHIVDLYNNGEMVQTPYVSYINPIPLTPEILEKCGFENKKLGKDYWELPNEKCINGWSEEFTFYLPYFEMNTYTGTVSIKALHQLQNLYFALTGEELKINL